MAVKVVKFRVRHKGEYRLPGDIIEGLSEQEEARLVSIGFAELIVPVEEIKSERNQQIQDQVPNQKPKKGKGKDQKEDFVSGTKKDSTRSSENGKAFDQNPEKNENADIDDNDTNEDDDQDSKGEAEGVKDGDSLEIKFNPDEYIKEGNKSHKKDGK